MQHYVQRSATVNLVTAELLDKGFAQAS